MAIQFSCDLLRRLSCPTLDDHLGMKLPIGWRVMALGQFTDLAFFLLVLRCSCLHMFGHGSIPFSVTFSSPMVSPLRNAALEPVHECLVLADRVILLVHICLDLCKEMLIH